MRPELTALPERMRELPLDDRGYPIPFFVSYVDGKPEFRGADAAKLIRCVKEYRCWVCGQKLGANLAFLIGPMCSINRISSEPPSHRECAEWSAKNCPFLTKPQMRRRDNDLPEDIGAPAGIMIARNPQVTLLWVTRGYKLQRDHVGKPLFSLGDPIEIQWWKEGRLASREEVATAIESGLPALEELAEQQGPEAVRDLRLQQKQAEKLLASLR